MSNLTASTRELWDRTVFKQVFVRLILLHMLLERKQVMNSGTAIKHTIDFEEMEDLFQEYGPNEPLDGSLTSIRSAPPVKAARASSPLRTLTSNRDIKDHE